MSLPLGSGPLKGYAVATLPGGEKTLRAALLTWAQASGAGDPAQEHRVLSHQVGGRSLAELAASALIDHAAKLASEFLPAPAKPEPAAEPVACLWTPAEKAEAVRSAERAMGKPDMVSHEQGPGGELREVYTWAGQGGGALLAFAYHSQEDVWEDISARVQKERAARAPTPEEVVDGSDPLASMAAVAAEVLEAEPLTPEDRRTLATFPAQDITPQSGDGPRAEAGGEEAQAVPPSPPAEALQEKAEREVDEYWGGFVTLREPLAEPATCAGCAEVLMPGAWPPEALSVRRTEANPPAFAHRGCVVSMMEAAAAIPPRKAKPKPTGWGEVKKAGRKLAGRCVVCGEPFLKGASYKVAKSPRGAKACAGCV